MIEIDYKHTLKEMEERLGDLSDRAPNLLRNALNTTARRIRKQVVKDAKGEYALSNKSLLQTTKAMKMTNAKPSNLTAVLRSEGPVNDLMEFMVSPTTLARGATAPDSYLAQVLKKSGYKALNGYPKPFITQFKSGHVAIVTRVPGKKMKSNSKKEFVRKLLSPSVPHMLQNPEVQEQANDMLARELPIQIEKQIQKILEKRG